MRHVRVVRGLRQQEVADRLAVSLSHYSKVEVGINRASNDLMKRFCEVFGVDSEWLRVGTGQPFHETHEEAAAYGNRLLAGGHVAAGLSEETLQRISAAISDLLAEVSVSKIQTSADELGIPVDKLLRVMILDRLHREFGCRADDDSGRR